MQMKGVNINYSLLVMVQSESSTGSPALWRTISNVPTSNTARQITCTIIINQLKIRNDSISARYPDFLKNGIFFNIVSPDSNIYTLESEHEHCGDAVEYVHNNFHD